VVNGNLRRTNYTTRVYCAVINSLLLFLVARAIRTNGVALESSLNGGRGSVKVGWISDCFVAKMSWAKNGSSLHFHHFQCHSATSQQKHAHFRLESLVMRQNH